MPADGPVVDAVAVRRTYAADDGAGVRALENVSLRADPGEVVAIVGPSGSGKSTLLFLLGGLDRPDQGSIRVCGIDWESLRGDERARHRRRTCGFVVQGMALLPQATALENVEVPLVLGGVTATDSSDRATAALERVGLANEMQKLPDQLSGGQQQRVAIARALVTEPALILADEPTGNVDSTTGQILVELILETAAEGKAAVVLVTHDHAVADHAGRIIELHSGCISREEAPGQ
jgi:putative ABC transport system ATP-binding protein